MDSILADVSDVDFGAPSGSFDEEPIYQNLIDPSADAEMREEGEENIRELILKVCPVKVSIRLGVELVISQT